MGVLYQNKFTESRELYSWPYKAIITGLNKSFLSPIDRPVLVIFIPCGLCEKIPGLGREIPSLGQKGNYYFYNLQLNCNPPGHDKNSLNNTAALANRRKVVSTTNPRNLHRTGNAPLISTPVYKDRHL